jgi:hypothetical protein
MTRFTGRRPNPLASANSRRPCGFPRLGEVGSSHMLSVLGAPAAVAERERSATATYA